MRRLLPAVLQGLVLFAHIRLLAGLDDGSAAPALAIGDSTSATDSVQSVELQLQLQPPTFEHLQQESQQQQQQQQQQPPMLDIVQPPFHNSPQQHQSPSAATTQTAPDSHPNATAETTLASQPPTNPPQRPKEAPATAAASAAAAAQATAKTWPSAGCWQGAYTAEACCGK
ncbi:unnamed protein product, partial [Polarella glacialis]